MTLFLCCRYTLIIWQHFWNLTWNYISLVQVIPENVWSKIQKAKVNDKTVFCELVQMHCRPDYWNPNWMSRSRDLHPVWSLVRKSGRVSPTIINMIIIKTYQDTFITIRNFHFRLCLYFILLYTVTLLYFTQRRILQSGSVNLTLVTSKLCISFHLI